MGAPVATITDTMADLSYVLSTREIYNEILAETEVTVDTDITVIDSPTEYGEGFATTGCGGLSAGASTEASVTGNGKPNLSWVRTSGYGHAADKSIVPIDCMIVSSSGNTCRVRFTNNTSGYVTNIYVTVSYTYLKNVAVTHEETESNTTTYQVSARDEVSINKYGKRTMSLDWPLGQTKAQMQALANAYLAKHKDPVPLAPMVLEARDDTNIVLILTLAISDKIKVVSSELGMSADFFINSVELGHNKGGVLTGTYMLEEVRSTETAAPAMWGTAEWGVDVWS
jgi:hypothetical protein